ncbi:transposase [Bernardetia sp. OM2101]|uniref:transposase n=1 Tax=Bernardetia sp. OM2101 TaxID=3344876 RepID=UPI0035D0A9B9
MKYQDAFEADTFYHVFNHAVGSENLFRNDDNFRYFLKRYNHYMSQVWETYCYCLMPNHFHFLVRIKEESELAKLPKYKGDTHKLVMQHLSNFLNSYAKSYNIKYQRKGALFLDFTKRKAVREESYYTTLINYIHQNPVHHKFCKTTDEWIYSSYDAFLSQKSTKIKRDEVLDWFGDRKAFQEFHKEHAAVLKEELEFE